jgi:ParB family transcriptional regulator, chromosome partitioning protein
MSADRPAKGLGMGLQALLGEAARPALSPGAAESQGSRGGVREIDIARIKPNPHQPRIQFDEEALDELAESIRERGVLQPILLKPHGEDYLIVAGERRWRAAQRARIHSIPAIVREIDESTTAEIALIENIQRQDLNPLEEAEGYRQLIQRHGHTQDDIGRIVHKSRSHVANLLRLLDLPQYVRQSLLQGDISMGHARAVATASDPEELTREIITKGLSVRQAEERVRRDKKRPGPGADIGRARAHNAAKTVDADLDALERQLGDILGLKVQVTHKGQGGSVNLHYSSLDQLDMICQRLSGEPI